MRSSSSRRIRRCSANGRPKVADAIKKVPGVVDVLNGIDNTISGPATMFQVDPTVAARAGFTPEEIELDASAIMQGEPASDARRRQRSRLYHPRPLSRPDTRFAGSHPEHAPGQLHRARRQPWVPWPASSNCPDKPRSAGTTSSGMSPSRPDWKASNLGSGIDAVQAGSRGPASAARHPSRVRRRLRGAAALLPRPGLGADPGRRAGVYRSAVRVRRFRRAPCRALLRPFFPLRACSWRC